MPPFPLISIRRLHPRQHEKESGCESERGCEQDVLGQHLFSHPPEFQLLVWKRSETYTHSLPHARGHSRTRNGMDAFMHSWIPGNKFPTTYSGLSGSVGYNDIRLGVLGFCSCSSLLLLLLRLLLLLLLIEGLDSWPAGPDAGQERKGEREKKKKKKVRRHRHPPCSLSVCISRFGFGFGTPSG